jgi:hypothetical protein
LEWFAKQRREDRSRTQHKIINRVQQVDSRHWR